MKNKNIIENKVDAVLNSINEIEAATPSPYFYTKVLAKINKLHVSPWEKWSAFFLRPAIAFASVCLIIIINAFVLYSKFDKTSLSKDTVHVASADEYSDAVTAFYNIENIKP